MVVTAAVGGVAEPLTGALSHILRWLKPDGTVATVDLIAADTAPLVIADDVVESVDDTLNTLTLTAHGLQTADGPIRLTTTGVLPAGLALLTDYWVIKDGVNTIQLTAMRGGSAINITDVGSGTHTLSDTVSTARGNLTTGRLKRVWVAGDTDLIGTHFGQAVVTRANGEVQTFPGDGSHYIWDVYLQLGND